LELLEVSEPQLLKLSEAYEPDSESSKPVSVVSSELKLLEVSESQLLEVSEA